MKAKYKMLHMGQENSSELSEELLKESIKDLLSTLEKEDTNSRLVVGTDYLTTMFMLWHLRNKYSLLEFFRMSKIDLIMQGDPYSASQEHLSQLRRKISLIDLFN